MFTHVALYRFRSDATKEQIETLVRELAICTEKTGLVKHYSSGLHVSLPADAAIRDKVYDFAAIWVFDSKEKLAEFSKHPLSVDCIVTYVQPVLEKLAVVNFATEE